MSMFGCAVSSLSALKEERLPPTPNNLVDIQAKLAAVNEEKMKAEDVMTLQQEENVSISGSNARLMIMKKLSRKQEVGVWPGPTRGWRGVWPRHALIQPSTVQGGSTAQHGGCG